MAFAENSKQKKSYSLVVGLVVIAAIAVFAIANYSMRARHGDDTSVTPKAITSSVNAAGEKESSGKQGNEAGEKGKAGSIDTLVGPLKARLEREPNDVDGWVLLGRSYHFLQNWNEATAAFAKARALGWKGEAPAITADATVAADSKAPGDIAPISQGDGAQAMFQGVQEAVEQQAQTLRNPEPVAEKNNATITASVSVETALAKKFGAESVVFIFVRPATGPRMPLAVVRKRLGDLPATIELSDAQAMMPEHQLSSATAVIVGARISASGSPTSQPGDIEVLSDTLAPAGQHIQLVLRPNP